MVCICVAVDIVFILKQISEKKKQKLNLLKKCYHFIDTRATHFRPFFSNSFEYLVEQMNLLPVFTIQKNQKKNMPKNLQCAGNKMKIQEIYTEHGLKILWCILMICT